MKSEPIQIILKESASFNISENILYIFDMDKIWRIEPQHIPTTTVRTYVASGYVGDIQYSMPSFLQGAVERFVNHLEEMGATDILVRYSDVPLSQVPFLTFATNDSNYSGQ